MHVDAKFGEVACLVSWNHAHGVRWRLLSVESLVTLQLCWKWYASIMVNVRRVMVDLHTCFTLTNLPTPRARANFTLISN